MCNKHYTTSVKTRFTFVFYTDSYIRGINHIFFLLLPTPMDAVADLRCVECGFKDFLCRPG